MKHVVCTTNYSFMFHSVIDVTKMSSVSLIVCILYTEDLIIGSVTMVTYSREPVFLQPWLLCY